MADLSLRPRPGDLARWQVRKGAARMALIPVDVLDALNRGWIASANLNEFLAVDLQTLVPCVAQELGLSPKAERLTDTLAMLGSFKPMERHRHVARAFYDLVMGRSDQLALTRRLAEHPSDVVRCWVCGWIEMSGASLAQQLERVKPFAADPHFGVRELAWMALRPAVVVAVPEALERLQPWVLQPDPLLRRFACELTRPKGVWCSPIRTLMAEPWIATDLLEPLRSDPDRYVQNSVANWLNDASKTQAEWVRATCARWQTQSPVPATSYIVRRALRTLLKNEQLHTI